LLYVYIQRNQPEEAMKVAASMVEKNPASHTGWYLKGCVELNLTKDYAAARESFKRAIEIDPTFVDANVNMAYTFMNEVVSRRNAGDWKLDRSNKAEFDKEFEEIKKYYEQALPYMEKVKELKPEDPKLWASALQQIYTNLQNKQKADEMDAIMANMYK
jgi:tetratricopeptide (TPR) repeat protein